MNSCACVNFCSSGFIDDVVTIMSPTSGWSVPPPPPIVGYTSSGYGMLSYTLSFEFSPAQTYLVISLSLLLALQPPFPTSCTLFSSPSSSLNYLVLPHIFSIPPSFFLSPYSHLPLSIPLLHPQIQYLHSFAFILDPDCSSYCCILWRIEEMHYSLLNSSHCPLGPTLQHLDSHPYKMVFPSLKSQDQKTLMWPGHLISLIEDDQVTHWTTTAKFLIPHKVSPIYTTWMITHHHLSLDLPLHWWFWAHAEKGWHFAWHPACPSATWPSGPGGTWGAGWWMIGATYILFGRNPWCFSSQDTCLC